MTSVNYAYSISQNTATGVVNSNSLTREITGSTITRALDYISTEADILNVWFKAALDTNEVATLTGIVGAHTGLILEDLSNRSSAGDLLVSWSEIKSLYASNPRSFLNYAEIIGYYYIWLCVDEQKMLVPELIKGTAEAIDFEANYKSKCNKQNDLSTTGSLLVEQSIHTGPLGAKAISLVTPDLADRTSWYQKSVQVVDEILTDSGDGLTFNSAHTWWVNIYGKLTYTHKQIPKRDGSFGKHADWAVVVKVNDVVQSSGYTVNYIDGKITFGATTAGSAVKVTYWHTDGVTNYGEWLLVPPAGKKYIVEHVEVQLSTDMQLPSPIRMEIWAGSTLATYGSFPEYLFDAGYGQMRADYRGMRDLINAANLGQGVIQHAGDLQNDVIVIPFNYVQAFILNSAQGALFRITNINNVPAIGELLTATFYLQIRDA